MTVFFFLLLSCGFTNYVLMDKTKYKEKEFNLEGPNAHKLAQKLIDKKYENCNNERQKFNRHEFYEYSLRAIENCEFLKSFYIQKSQKSQNSEDVYYAFLACYVNNLMRRLYNPIIDSNNFTLAQQNYIKKKLEKERDYYMKNLILGLLQIAYRPYVEQTVRKIMNNYAYIKYKPLPKKKRLNYGKIIKIINEDIKKFLGIDMEGIKNNKIKVNYNNIIEHLVTENHPLDIIEKIHKEIEDAAKGNYGVYTAYQNIESTPCDSKMRMWGMEEQIREKRDKCKNKIKKQALDRELKNLQTGKGVDIDILGP